MFISALLLLAAGEPLPAQPTAEAAKTKTERRDDRDPNKIICKREPVIGSRLNAKKKCHTRAEWREMELGTTKAVRDSQREGRANSTIGN